VGDRILSPEECSSLILRQLKEDVERYLRESIEDVVITVPANWKDTQRRATWTAGKLAGLNVTRLINEPTAAAMAYGLRPDAEGKTIAVYDLGGGTFDITILKIRGRVFDVLTSEGDDHLGGMDFDTKLLLMVLEDLKRKHGYVLSPLGQRDAELEKRIRGLEVACEEAKKELSFSPDTELIFPFFDTLEGQPVGIEMEISRNQFQALVEDDIQRSIWYMEKAIREASLSPEAIDEVVLVGGSTRIPLVRERVADLVGKEPLTTAVNPDEAVAMGAAIQAAIIGEDVTEDSPIVLDIATSHLGIECVTEINGRVVSGVFSRIIEKGSKLPARNTNTYVTAADDQEAVEILCFEGEHPIARQNKPIGQPIEITGLPPKPAGDVKVLVTFSYDPSQLLQVKAEIPGTDLQAEECFKLRQGTCSDEELERRRRELDTMAQGKASRNATGAGTGSGSRPQWESSPLAPRYRGVILRAEETLANAPGEGTEEFRHLAETLEGLKDAIVRGDKEEAEELDLELTDILFDMM